MNIAAMLSAYPAPRPASATELEARVASSNRVFVVLDDDPTGTQSVANLPVLTRWRTEDLGWAFDTGAPAVYVLTNSRAFGPEEAARMNKEIVHAALEAAQSRQLNLTFVSRGDSTLRGHFPLEPDVLADTLVECGKPRPDGVILVPAFPDAGRVTIGGVHGMREDDTFTPAGETEFARDSTFGYSASRLANWVEEKSAGKIPASAVVEITLDVLRAGGDAVVNALREAPTGSVIVADAENEDDMRHLALGLDVMERAGHTYVYRVGPPFVRARIGQMPSEPITLTDATEDASVGGLIVVGSHVGLTTRQLAHLKANRPHLATVELDVSAVLASETARDTIDEAVSAVRAAISQGDVVVHSSRTLVRSDDPDESLSISRKVSDALVEIVQRTVAEQKPRFVIAKGGITSSDTATRGLSISRAEVVGSLFPGLVSVWRPVAGPATGTPYIVFAGNVGSDTSLTEAVAKLSATA